MRITCERLRRLLNEMECRKHLAAGNELSWATYIQDNAQWSVTLYPDGRVELEEDQEPYYKRV